MASPNLAWVATGASIMCIGQQDCYMYVVS